jgi:DNA transformation protein
MSIDEGLYAWVCEALEPIGTVSMRKMMGAAVLYLDGIVFAVLDDELWLKADAESAPIWDAAGCARFSFTLKGGTVESMNYRRAPSEVHDDAEAMQHWANVAVAAGQRAAAKKRPRGKAANAGRSRGSPRSNRSGAA